MHSTHRIPLPHFSFLAFLFLKVTHISADEAFFSCCYFVVFQDAFNSIVEILSFEDGAEFGESVKVANLRPKGNDRFIRVSHDFIEARVDQ